MPQFPANQPLLACNEFRRARFHQDADSSTQAAHARTVLQMLLAQDGSTTRLCETLAASAISVQVFEQDMVDALPGQLHDALPGARFIRRLSSLVANGDVLLDSLSFIALEGLPEDIRRPRASDHSHWPHAGPPLEPAAIPRAGRPLVRTALAAHGVARSGSVPFLRSRDSRGSANGDRGDVSARSLHGLSIRSRRRYRLR